jgi:hypothetical protein
MEMPLPAAKVGRPRKAGERTASGRLKRDSFIWHTVYLAVFPSVGAVKIGCTKHIKNRWLQYCSQFDEKPIFAAKFLVSSKEESRELEKACMDFLATKYERRKREWFLVAMGQVPEIVRQLQEIAKGWDADERIICSPDEQTRTVFDDQLYDLQRMARGHKATQGIYI